MANKRMFNNSVLDSDAFLDLPLSAQALYFHLNLRADDDGFISKPKRIQAYIGASEDDLKLLILKRFVIAFEDGVIVIKHWRMHNTIQKDRYHPTLFQEEFKMLGIKENKAYTLDVSKMETPCIQTVSSDLGLDKDLDIGIDKELDSDTDIGIDNPPTPKKEPKHKYGEYQHVLLTDAERERLVNDFGEDITHDAIKFLDEYIEEKGYKSKSHNLAIRRWVINAVSEKQKKQTTKHSELQEWANA